MADEYQRQAEPEAIQYVSIAVIVTNRVAIGPVSGALVALYILYADHTADDSSPLCGSHL